MQFDRLELLMKQQGKTKKHMGEIVGKGGYYVKDCKTKGIQVPETIVRAWADDLNTSYEYLMGEDEPAPKISMDGAFRAGKSRFTHSLGVMNIAGEIAERTKFIEMYEQIAEKETAEADLQELQRFMEYLVNRGE